MGVAPIDEDREFLLQSSRLLSNEERAFVVDVDLNGLQSTLHEFLQSSRSAQLRHRNKSILRQTGARAVSFADNFSQYLTAYSGIVEVVKGADQQYGGLAYGILSLLLIVGVNKKRTESCIDDTLLTLRKEYQRMNALIVIHPSPTLNKYIQDAFILGIQFAKFALSYFTRSSWRRVLRAMTRPPTTDLDKIQEDIHKAVIEVEKERNHLNTKRLQDVQHSVAVVENTVEAVDHKLQQTNLQLQGLQLQHNEVLLRQIRNHLGVKGGKLTESLAKYDHVLRSVFRPTPRFSPFSFEQHLKDQSEYKRWVQSSESALLLLYGGTKARSGDCCWLSPAAHHIVTAMVPVQETATTAYLCQPEELPTREIPAAEVMKDIAYQLIEKGRHKLNEPSHSQQILNKSSMLTTHPGNIEAHCSLLEQVAALHGSVVMVIDRIDRIKGDTWRWLGPIVRLVKDDLTLKLQVFLIASSNGNKEPGGKLPPLLFETLRGQLDHRFCEIEIDNV